MLSQNPIFAFRNKRGGVAPAVARGGAPMNCNVSQIKE